jgi:hypothetical protein
MTETIDTKPGRLESALDDARHTARRAGKAIEANPVAVVAGGIALGVVAGALLPRTQRETELLGPVGKRVTEAAAGAVGAAKVAAVAELGSIPLSREAARDQVGKFIDQVGKAMASAGQAALSHGESARDTVVEAVTPAKTPRKAK